MSVVDAIVAAWDRLPVKGLVALAAAVGGFVAAFAQGGLAHGDCQRTPLIHVYRPQRFQLVERCADVTGTVVAWRHEHDGDVHVNMRVDDSGWVNDANARGQHGLTVVEFVPLMPRPDHFSSGQRLRLRVTKVTDQQHRCCGETVGWVEGHPVFAFDDVTPRGLYNAPLGPNRPELAPATEGE